MLNSLLMVRQLTKLNIKHKLNMFLVQMKMAQLFFLIRKHLLGLKFQQSKLNYKLTMMLNNIKEIEPNNTNQSQTN